MAQESAPDGADFIAGGAGRDTVDFSLRSAHIRVILDNVGNDGADAAHDGAAEEGDDVRADVEDVWTGGGSDYVNASTKPANAAGSENLLRGGANDDTLLGGHAEDHLEGGFGADTLTGGIGEDLLEGGHGADRFIAQDQYFDVIDGGFGDLDVDGVNSKDAYDSVINVP
jgi:Ca2+-binding RTX toxin-like protein